MQKISYRSPSIITSSGDNFFNCDENLFTIFSEFLSIVALAAKTNQLVNGLQVPIDDVFDADKQD